jgi:2-amino-4-hydroxy-6-hydroxymethyldihydropteridine diphosphokinase
MRILFGLGSNLGDRNFYLDAAIKDLIVELFLIDDKRSNIFANPAMLLPNSPPEWNCEFLNIAFSADIDLEKFSPQKILEIIKKIEKKFDRNHAYKWAPREIDIDILAIGDLKIALGEELIVPHPGLFKRDFFIKTAMEIEGEWMNKLREV